MANELNFDINELIVPEDKRETGEYNYFKHLEEEATPVTVPTTENETTEQRIARMNTQFVENQKVKEQKEVLNASRQYPELGNTMYQLREATVNEDSQFKSKLTVDSEGKPSLAVQMEGAIGFDFSIHDGKVVFNGDISDDKLLEILDFLYRRGIRNFELPSNQKGTTFDEVYTRVQQQREADKQTHMPEPPARENTPFNEITFENPNESQRTNETQAAMAAQATPQQATSSQTASTTGTSSNTLNTWNNPNNPTIDKTSFKEVTKNFEEWLGEGNQKKKKNLSWFREGGLLNKLGATNSIVYSVYPNEDKNNLSNDGKRDKNGIKKETCAYRVELTEGSDGKLKSIGFYIPNDGKIPDALADKFADMVKTQGALFMNFPKTLNPGDAGVIRAACARAGIIPKGKSFNLNKQNAEDMIAEAQKTIGRRDKAKFLKYKQQMGKHLLTLETDPKSERYQYAKELIKDAKYADLEKTLDPLLKDIEKESRKPGAKAEEIIGSANAIKDLHTLFDSLGSQSLIDIANNDGVDDYIKRAVQATSLDKSKAVEDLSSDEITALYKALQKENIEQTRNTLNEKTRNSRPDKANEVVERQLQGAQKTINSVISFFNRKDLKDLSCDINENIPTFTRTTPPQQNNQTALAAARARLAQNS